MEMNRRTFLGGLGTVAVTPALANSPEARGMYGLIVKMTLLTGKRDEMITILRESAASMPGCFSYVVAKGVADDNILWVTEGLGQRRKSRCLCIVACREKRDTARQSHRC
jgi:hypothetical protein